jgi:hypothetical protein
MRTQKGKGTVADCRWLLWVSSEGWLDGPCLTFPPGQYSEGWKGRGAGRKDSLWKTQLCEWPPLLLYPTLQAGPQQTQLIDHLGKSHLLSLSHFLPLGAMLPTVCFPGEWHIGDYSQLNGIWSFCIYMSDLNSSWNWNSHSASSGCITLECGRQSESN